MKKLASMLLAALVTFNMVCGSFPICAHADNSAIFDIDATNCYDANANVILINTSKSQSLGNFFTSKSYTVSDSDYSNWYAIRVEKRSDGDYSVIQAGHSSSSTATQIEDGFILLVKESYINSFGKTLPTAHWPEGGSGDHTTPSNGYTAVLTGLSANVTTTTNYNGSILGQVIFGVKGWNKSTSANERPDDLETASNDNIEIKLFNYSMDINKAPLSALSTYSTYGAGPRDDDIQTYNNDNIEIKLFNYDMNINKAPSYEAGTYSIRFNANGGEGGMNDQIVEYDIPTALSASTFFRDGYTFAGWSLTRDGPVEYINEQTIVNAIESGQLNLYAVWIQNSHTVTFDYTGGSGSTTNKQVLEGGEYGVLPTYPTKDQHLFAGWYTEPEGGTRVYPDDIASRTEDHTLYAQWKYSPANEIIQDLVIKNNPDDNRDGIVDDINLNFACSSYYEKFNVPIENLEVGQRYKLSFIESNNATFGNNESGYGSAIYGSIITTEGTLEKGSIKAESIADGGLIAQWSDVSKGNDWLNGPRNWEMTFTAEASTMYWTWDMGIIQDGETREYNFRNIKIELIPPEINFEDYTLIDPDTYKAEIVRWDSNTRNLSLEFNGNSGVETIYYPITGLVAGTRYSITFNHKFVGSLIGSNSDISKNSYDYGCGIMNSIPQTATAKMSNLGTWASNTFVLAPVSNSTEEVTLTFTASGDTAYWVWNLANVSDSVNCTIDVEVTEFKGGNQVYKENAQYRLMTLSNTLFSAAQSSDEFRPIATYFAFRGAGTLGETYPDPAVNADYDADGFSPEHATVERVLKDGFPILNLSTNTLNEPRVDPGLTEAERDMGYLFGKMADHAVTIYEPTNSILKLEDNWYSYDSKENAVDYDIDNNLFRLRSYAERNQSTAGAAATGMLYNDFLPFNYTGGIAVGTAANGNSYNILTADTEFWFGMSMKAKFYQPKDGVMSNEDMIFHFAGDDDVWVFIDNVLVLDLGGTHGVVEGSINFKTGEIVQRLTWNGATNVEGENQYTTTIKEQFDLAGEEPNGGWDESGEIFEDYTRHTLSMFYLERGAGTANCRLEFNLPILPKHSINVEKTLSGDEVPQLGNPNFMFQILDSSDNTKLADESFLVYDTSTNTLVGEGVTDGNGCFTIKAGQRATFDGLDANQGEFKVRELLDVDFFKQYCEVTVDGVVYATDLIQSDIVLGSETFKGFVSPNKNISDGALYFVFDNKIDVEEFGSLCITKQLGSGTSIGNGYDPIFKAYVTLDNIPLPVGTAYTLDGESLIVEEAGIVNVKIGKDTIIPEIISSATYYVEEIADSQQGYNVEYTNNSGVILNKTQHNVIIINTPAGPELPLTGGNDLWIIAIGTLILISSITIIRKNKYKPL